MLGFCPSWEIREASVDRVVVAAGILEDPFGGITSCPCAIPCWPDGPTLAAAQTWLTLFGLAKHDEHPGLIEIVGVAHCPWYKLSLSDIREAYRQKALACHPDAGGSAEDMRRLNEASQLLKQRYVRTS